MKVKVTISYDELVKDGISIFEMTDDLSLLLIPAPMNKIDIYLVDKAELNKLYEGLKNG